MRINKTKLKNNIIVSDGSATITLNPNYYSKASFDEAIEIFKEDCSITRTHSHEIQITPKKGDAPNKLALEFANYCLSLMK